MQAEQSLDQEREVCHVAAWKRGIDKNSPRFRLWFFNQIYMRFIRWSFKWMKIPAPAGAEVRTEPDGTIITEFLWYEDQGIFEDEGRAEAACLEPTWGWKRFPLNKLLPKESVKYAGRTYPRAKKPQRWTFPNYDMVPIPRRHLKNIINEVKAEVARTHKALDA